MIKISARHVDPAQVSAMQTLLSDLPEPPEGTLYIEGPLYGVPDISYFMGLEAVRFSKGPIGVAALTGVVENGFWPGPQGEPLALPDDALESLVATGVSFHPKGTETMAPQRYLPVPFFARPPEDGILRPVLFLDRDGVINRDHGYVFRSEDIEFFPWAIELMKLAQEQGLSLVVLTNQSGVGRGYYSEEDVSNLHEWMQAQLLAEGVAISGWYHCPYHPEGLGAWKGRSLSRKPGPGLALKAATELSLDLSRALMVGDKGTDDLNFLEIPTWLVSGDYDHGEKGAKVFKTGASLVRAFSELIQK
jgi:D-glycero-D-manno-heptose 1,7-bisphosphate phosphatase